MKHLALVFPLALAALPATATARPHDKGHGDKNHDGPGKGHEGACRADRERLCKDAGDKAETRACMVTHKAELAPACREHIEARAAFEADCKAPLEAYCAEVPPGRGAVMGCLIGHKADLQPACRKHVDDALAKFAERRERRGKDGKKGDKPGK
jgi:hypothetical protein